jgi:hypothetical protein
MAAAIGLGFAFSPAAHASEGGINHYASGINTVFNGILPAPGTLQFYNYSAFQSAGTFAGANGKSLYKGFSLNSQIEGPRFVYTYPFSLGNFHISSGIVPVFGNVNLSIEGQHGHHFGLLDTDLEPLYISYSNPKKGLFAYFGPDLFVPTGDYKIGRLVNTGQNYTTVAVGFHGTWLPNRRWELSFSAVPEFNTTNTADHYRSGDIFTLDWSVDYRPLTSVPKLKVALQGFMIKQFQDDTVMGKSVEGGFRGQAFAAGPQIVYDLPHGGILFKVQQEFAVRNRPKGTTVWLELTLPIHSRPKAAP